jgi:hypothetical protein
MTSAISSDSQLRQLVESFFEHVKRCAVQNVGAVRNDVNIRIVRGLVFNIDRPCALAQRQLVARTVQILGPDVCHEDQMSSLAWNIAAEQISDARGDPKVFVDEFLKALQLEVLQTFTYVAPNNVIRFARPGQRLQIGPIDAVLATDVLPELQASQPKNVSITVGDRFCTTFSDRGIEFQLPPVIWRVRVCCAPQLVEEQALWRVNIALSYLRLSYDGPFPGLFPHIGDREAPPIEERRADNTSLSFSETGMSGGGWSVPFVYTIDDAITDVVTTPDFKWNANIIFNAKKGSVAERFAAGLGWLTCARQSADRAERFLYFFTALEALLSGDDKTAPVVQTIARHAAVILYDDVSKRFEFARRLRELYGLRSALVHAGKREVSQFDVNEIQYFAEVLYKLVLRRCPLTKACKDFHLGLTQASYGTVWSVPSE